jgi:hypothetical protein
VRQREAEQFRFGGMTEENADVVKPTRFGVEDGRLQKNLRVVIEMPNEQGAPDSVGAQDRSCQTLE